MQELTFESPMPVPHAALFDWHARPGAFQRLTPPWAPVELVSSEGIEPGDRAVIRLGRGPFKLRWVAEHQAYEAGRQFRDVQVRGPFQYWVHTHRMEPGAPGTSRLVDHIEYTPPLGEVGELFGGKIVREELTRQFAYRHRVTRQDLAWHARYNPGGRRLRVAVSGASGLVGSALSAVLTTGGHEVVRLVRRPAQADDEAEWNPGTGAVDTDRLEGLDAVVHLAGESVFGLRWTEAKKRRIYDSRVEGTKLLAEALARLDDPPGVFVSASAIGHYGDRGQEVITEDTPPSDDAFLAEVTRAWEAAAEPAARAGIRTVHPRIGVVLTPAGGALQLMLPAFRLGLGGRVGAKDQYFSWITLDDVLGALLHLVFTDDLDGPVNLTAPNPATMQAFAKTLARVLRRPALVTVPNGAVRALAGQMADEMLLSSARVQPQRLLDTDYRFAYPDLEGGLRHLLGRTTVFAPASMPEAAS